MTRPWTIILVVLMIKLDQQLGRISCFSVSYYNIQRKQIHLRFVDLVKTYRHKATFWKIFAGTENNPLSLKTKAII